MNILGFEVGGKTKRTGQDSLESRLAVLESSENRSTLTSPDIITLLSNFYGMPSKSGIAINEKTALSHSAVFACVNVLSQTIASLPLEVFEAKTNGDLEKSVGHAVHRLVNAAPNGFQTSYDFRSQGQLHLGLRGNFYALIVRDALYRPIELRPLDPRKVRPHLIDWRIWYEVEGMKDIVSADDMIHVKGLSFDGVVGESPISVARETIGLGLAATDYSGKIFKNGAHISGVLEHPGKLTPEQHKNVKENWNGRNSGMEGVGSTPILEAGMKFVPISMTPQDSQFVQTAKLSIEDVARIYRVPLHLIGSLERSTNNNIEQQSLEFATHTIRPLVKSWEQELNKKLFRTSEQGRFFVKFNLDAMLRGDIKTRTESYARLFNIGVFSQNEIRRLEGMNGIGAEGDTYYVQLNMGNPNAISDANGNSQTDNNNAEASAAAANA